MTKYPMPEIDEDDLSPKSKIQVNALQSYAEDMAEIVTSRDEQIIVLLNEIAILKGQKKRPIFKPSGMHEEAGQTADDAQKKGQKTIRPGSVKRSKTKGLEIDSDCRIKPAEPLPQGSRFKCYRDFVVQDIVITRKNTRYRLECWQTPDGRLLTGKLPHELQGRHFGPTLVAFIFYQHHQNHVTQPRLHQQLCDMGVDISVGQINAILMEGNARFHEEKNALLVTALTQSSYVTVDDTGARHQGKNGFVTHVGNQHFAFFHTSESKSRINFLKLLRAGKTNYRINADALAHMEKQGLSSAHRDALLEHKDTDFADKMAWIGHMDALGINAPAHRRSATEGALLGSISDLHVAKNMAIISDDAGQFNVLTHGLCWIHTERLVHKLLPLNEKHRNDIAQVRDEIWTFYADLKSYKTQPCDELSEALRKRFDAIFIQVTSFRSLNQLLWRIHDNKSELLLVLDRPEIPLHTNDSERDIRDHVLKQKISGGTRSDDGRQCRDTFSSLNKTCRKLDISFWHYLTDRFSFSDQIPPLHDIIEQRIASL